MCGQLLLFALFICFFVYLFISKTEPYYVAQTALKFVILLPRSAECLDYRHVPLRPAPLCLISLHGKYCWPSGWTRQFSYPSQGWGSFILLLGLWELTLALFLETWALLAWGPRQLMVLSGLVPTGKPSPVWAGPSCCSTELAGVDAFGSNEQFSLLLKQGVLHSAIDVDVRLGKSRMHSVWCPCGISSATQHGLLPFLCQ